jgi:hypothetical protein
MISVSLGLPFWRGWDSVLCQKSLSLSAGYIGIRIFLVSIYIYIYIYIYIFVILKTMYSIHAMHIFSQYDMSWSLEPASDPCNSLMNGLHTLLTISTYILLLSSHLFPDFSTGICCRRFRANTVSRLISYVFHPSHLPWFDLPSNIYWSMQISCFYLFTIYHKASMV